MSSFEALLAQAMALPVPERGMLVARLLGSLEPADEDLSPEAWEAVWTEELTRRLRDLREGRVVPVEGGVARARVRAAVAARRP
jgi:putative addiction module component (TIGR02574 family)